MSCATALSKVSLIVGLKSDMIQASASALLEYYRLRRYSNFFSALENDTKIILALLNIRGLVNNLDNFLADVNIQSVPVVCLTDTHLRNSHNNRQLIIQNKMPDFDIIFSNSSDIYKSLALVFKKDMFACQDSVLPDGFLFVKLLSFCHFLSFKLLILYRKKILVLINFFRFLLILYNLSNKRSFLVILMKIVCKNLPQTIV